MPPDAVLGWRANTRSLYLKEKGFHDPRFGAEFAVSLGI